MEVNGKLNIVIFRRIVLFILNEFYRRLLFKSLEEEKLLMIEIVVKLIKVDIMSFKDLKVVYLFFVDINLE